MSSSPVICVSNATYYLLRLIFLIIYLKVSFREACQLILIEKSEPDSRDNFLHLRRKFQKYEGIESFTLPRVLFFVIGILPAAIKLFSFSGVPCTLVWGLMFLCSYAFMEVVTFIAKPGKRQPTEESILLERLNNLHILPSQDLRYREQLETRLEILRRLQHRLEEADQHNDLWWSWTFTRRPKFLRTLNLLLAIFAHLRLVIWAIEDIWNSLTTDQIFTEELHEELFRLAASLVTSIILTSVAIYMPLWLLFRALGKIQNGSFANRCALWVFISSLLAYLPAPLLFLFKENSAQNISVNITMIYLLTTYILSVKIIKPLCKRWPRIADTILKLPPGRGYERATIGHRPATDYEISFIRTLHLTPNVQGGEYTRCLPSSQSLVEEMDIGTMSTSDLEVLLGNIRTTEIAQNNSIQQDDNIDPSKLGEIGLFGKYTFHVWCLFFVSGAVCILWYANVYESRGTVNPGWTSVFG